MRVQITRLDIERAEAEKRITELEKDVITWRMAAELVAHDLGGYSQALDSPPEFYVVVNDMFGYATADAEGVPFDEIPVVYAAWKMENWKGIVRWVAKRRGVLPLPEIRRALENL